MSVSISTACPTTSIGARARELRVDNGVNPGLGLRYRVAHSECLQWIFDAGAYRDSGRNTALIAGAGGLWHATSRLRLGRYAGLLGDLVAALSGAA